MKISTTAAGKWLIGFGALLLGIACSGEDNGEKRAKMTEPGSNNTPVPAVQLAGANTQGSTPTTSGTPAATPKALVSSSAAPASTPPLSPGAATVSVRQGSLDREQKMVSQSHKRPDFKQFIEGGQLLRKIKTDFFKPGSWLVFYQTTGDFPALKVILLVPNDNGQYQKYTVDSYDYDGGIPQAKEIFFTNVDSDKEKELVILCAWENRHAGLDIDATNYQVFIYDNSLESGTQRVHKMQHLMDKFGTGMDGMVEGERHTYQWKDKAAILQALAGFAEVQGAP